MRRLTSRTVIFSSSPSPAPAAWSTRSLWMRRLTLVFGSTTLAVSTVLAAFMGGLAARQLPVRARGQTAIRARALRALRPARDRDRRFGGRRAAAAARPPSAVYLGARAGARGLAVPLLRACSSRSSRRSSCCPRADGRHAAAPRALARRAREEIGAARGSALRRQHARRRRRAWRRRPTSCCRAWASRPQRAVRRGRSTSPPASPRCARAARGGAPVRRRRGSGARAAAGDPRPRRPSGSARALLWAIAPSGFAAMVYEVAWARLVALVLGQLRVRVRHDAAPLPGRHLDRQRDLRAPAPRATRRAFSASRWASTAPALARASLAVPQLPAGFVRASPRPALVPRAAARSSSC